MPQIGAGKGDGPSGHEDFGRERVTGDLADRFKFRVPTLRMSRSPRRTVMPGLSTTWKTSSGTIWTPFNRSARMTGLKLFFRRGPISMPWIFW